MYALSLRSAAAPLRRADAWTSSKATSFATRAAEAALRSCAASFAAATPLLVEAFCYSSWSFRRPTSAWAAVRLSSRSALDASRRSAAASDARDFHLG